MFALQNVLLAGLALAIIVILLQDFAHRLVSLWILLVFGAICVMSVLLFRDLETLLYNTIACVFYFGFIWLGLKLYFYLKYRQNNPILNESIGSADVLLMLFIGITFDPAGLIFFFCFGFIFSLIFYFLYLSVFKKQVKQSVPLAGLLGVFYGLTIIILYLVKANYYIDCSFVNYE
jgi:hypothetical protein